MKRIWIILFLAACAMPFSMARQPTQTQPTPPPPKTVPGEIPGELEAAFLGAAQAELEGIYAVQIFDVRVENVNVSDDGNFASAWLVPVNPQTGEDVPAEPSLALATWDETQWAVTLPGDPDWLALLAQAPALAVPGEIQEQWLGPESAPLAPTAPAAALTGYLLPWAEGKTVWLSRSVAHDGSFASGNAHYSFDFYISKTMFDLHASKAGTVWAFKDTVADNDHSDVNFIVLQDTTTTPVTYQLYMHLAQNSIPPALKSVGTPVAQGQFIGVADNTGQSTGHHLHFQVETEPYWQGYWGKSVDVVFSDVSINGGRPRVAVDLPYCDWPSDVCQTTQSSYVSRNVVHEAANLPRGDLTAPQTGTTLTNSSLLLAGWAADDEGLSSVRFKANYAGDWSYIGPTFTTSPYSFSWDVCSAGVPDGPVSVAVEIIDVGGNLASGIPGLRHFVKQYDCGPPQPACAPNADQVALFAETGYQGACTVLGSGEYQGSSQLGGVGGNNAASIMVGSNVLATLYADDDLSERSETLSRSDSNLDDNRIGSNTLSSMLVRARSQPPAAPRPLFPSDAEDRFTSDDTIGLVWEDGGGANEFKVRLDGVEKSWQSSPLLRVGPLTSGTHNWQVKARNSAGESSWSSTYSIAVQSGDAPGSTRSAPFSDDMEDGFNDWSNSSNWDQTDEQNHSSGGSVSWGYEPGSASQGYSTGEANSGDLTVPPVSIPSTGTYSLRFYYQYETESQGVHWDQRWVQISTDGGPFQDVLQLSDDPLNIWLQSPAIDLAAYRGNTIRVRFHFETLDALNNAFRGWYIDDLSITAQAPAVCSDSGEPNNTPAQATAIAKNTSRAGVICPNGDVDYYKFDGAAGEQVGVSTQAQTAGSDLDTYLYLLDSDGTTPLAANDDIVNGVRTDSFVSYRLPQNGTYYIKLRAWNHPSIGGESYTYNIHLVSETTRPSAAITNPASGTFLPSTSATLSVSAGDSPAPPPGLPGGISHVDFFWHPGEWLASDWIYLGSDWEGESQWSYDIDTSTITDQRDIGFFIKAYDWAGNTAGAAIWGLGMDRTPPETAMKSIPGTVESTAVLLEWTANDDVSGLGSFDLQSKIGSGAWSDFLLGVNGALRQAWAVIEPGVAYGFRMRGVDRIGNAESYPSSAEASIQVDADFCDSPDRWENDNSRTTASNASGVVTVREHNFCNPQAGSGYLNDQDWVKVNLRRNARLIATAQSNSGGAAAVLRLYAADGTTLLQEARASGFGETVQLIWDSTIDGVAYLQVTHLDGRAAGNDVSYTLIIRNGYHSFMPFIQK